LIREDRQFATLSQSMAAQNARSAPWAPSIAGGFHMPIFEEVRTITADGRLVVPWVIQRALGLEQGGPVRFRVDNGVVTLIAVDGRRPETPAHAEPSPDAPAPGRRIDVRQQLAAELNDLLATSGQKQPAE
jgi:bifunctional DNA-binding transcriptional regulator/antitoxin component of YhaV-PrlF toxin-antitoxin module